MNTTKGIRIKWLKPSGLSCASSEIWILTPPKAMFWNPLGLDSQNRLLNENVVWFKVLQRFATEFSGTLS